MDNSLQQAKSPDKRRAVRTPILVMKVAGAEEKVTLFGYAKNISRGGLFIQSVNPRKPGERFSVSFKIPGTPIEARCRCEVVWMREYRRKVASEPGYGVRFLDLAEPVAREIDDWVKTQI